MIFRLLIIASDTVDFWQFLLNLRCVDNPILLLNMVPQLRQLITVWFVLCFLLRYGIGLICIVLLFRVYEAFGICFRNMTLSDIISTKNSKSPRLDVGSETR